MKHRPLQFTIGALMLAMLWLGIGLSAHDQIGGVGFVFWSVIIALTILAMWPGSHRPL